jgi:SAM-dependent methyltransferase
MHRLATALALTACAACATSTPPATPPPTTTSTPTAAATARPGNTDMHDDHDDHDAHDAHDDQAARDAHDAHDHHDATAAHGGSDMHDVHHRFDHAEEWAKRFEDPSRDAWQKPDDVIAMMALQPDDVVADIGAATGYFPVRVAKRVPQGKVYGVDIEPDMVRYLNERAAREGLPNLVAVLGAPDDPKLPEPVDVVIVVDTYHHIEGRTAYFTRLAPHVKPGGRLVIVDFKPGDLAVGPPPAMKIAAGDVVNELAAAGWKLAKRDDALLPYQYVLVLVRG